MAQTIKTFFDLGGARAVEDPRVAEQQRQQQLAIEEARRQDALRAALAGEQLQRQQLAASQQSAMARLGLDQQRLGFDREKFTAGREEAQLGREADMLLEQLRQGGMDSRQQAGFGQQSLEADAQRRFLGEQGLLDRQARSSESALDRALREQLDANALERFNTRELNTTLRHNESLGTQQKLSKQREAGADRRAKESNEMRLFEALQRGNDAKAMRDLQGRQFDYQKTQDDRRFSAQEQAQRTAQRAADMEAIKPYVAKLIEGDEIGALEMSLLTQAQRDLLIESFMRPQEEQNRTAPQTFVDNFGDGRPVGSPLDIIRNPNASKTTLQGGDRTLGNQQFDEDMLKRILGR